MIDARRKFYAPRGYFVITRAARFRLGMELGKLRCAQYGHDKLRPLPPPAGAELPLSLCPRCGLVVNPNPAAPPADLDPHPPGAEVPRAV